MAGRWLDEVNAYLPTNINTEDDPMTFRHMLLAAALIGMAATAQAALPDPHCPAPAKHAVGTEHVAQWWRGIMGRGARGPGSRYCAPGAHIWVPFGTAPGTGRPILRCSRCGMTKIQ